jgi:hypothetical protein
MPLLRLAWLTSRHISQWPAPPYRFFWPCLEKSWNTIFVTHEISVTTGYGQFPVISNDVELHSISSDKNLRSDAAQLPDGWEPFVGDETTGLGENETVIESTVAVKRSKKFKIFSN